MSALQKLPSIDEYLVFEQQAVHKHEYVAGQIYAMAGATATHNTIALNLAFHLRQCRDQCGIFASDVKLYVQHNQSFYYPDVMLYCDATDQHELYKERPCLLAEVLSPSTEQIDRREKLFAYQGIDSLRYYLLIDSQQCAVMYYQRDRAGDWQSANLDIGEELLIACGEFTVKVSLEQIYDGVDLAV